LDRLTGIAAPFHIDFDELAQHGQPIGTVPGQELFDRSRRQASWFERRGCTSQSRCQHKTIRRRRGLAARNGHLRRHVARCATFTRDKSRNRSAAHPTPS
jgi:hypothetical protein